MQAIYSDQHRYLDGGYGVKYETAAIHPSLLVVVLALARRRASTREMMEALPHSVADRRRCCATATAAR